MILALCPQLSLFSLFDSLVTPVGPAKPSTWILSFFMVEIPLSREKFPFPGGNSSWTIPNQLHDKSEICIFKFSLSATCQSQHRV